jgi:hypothetical protein
VIDQEARERASGLLGRWRAGTLTNWELEDEWPKSQDHGRASYAASRRGLTFTFLLE